jgi:simple sugar transport system ATP-binding protein/D-xylose transport system ATP-binding protein
MSLDAAGTHPNRLAAPAVPALTLNGIGKSFGQVRALAHVDFAAHPGEIHCIVGDNGAGKSTALKILSGIYQADAGEMTIDGREVVLKDAAEAHKRGIAVVHQDLALIECLDVATNMALGAIPRRGRFLLDEPTAALGVRETAHVGEILDQLRAGGKTIICISHDLEFVFAHADRITVMRLGNSVATRVRDATSRDEIVGMITGTIGGGADPEGAGR